MAERRPPRPDVLLITIDTLRADRLGCYGFKPARTRHIDALAAGGVLCTDVLAAAPITMPSHATILTGLYPPAHGVRDNGTFSLSEKIVTLTEKLQEVGYDTAAFVSALVLNRRYGLDQGFALYDDDLWAEADPKLFMIRERPATKTLASFFAWFKGRERKNDRRPFFTWLHFFEPHQPYAPPLWARLITPTLYDGEIATADREIGRLVDFLRRHGRLDSTLILLTADHGESLGEHHEKTHAIFIYQATVHVPMIVRFPGYFAAGSVCTAPLRTADITPTLLGFLDIPMPGKMQGMDIRDILRGAKPGRPMLQYCESRVSELGFGMAPLYGVVRDGLKYIRAPRPELYDLRSDPDENKNLYHGRSQNVVRLESDVKTFLEAGLPTTPAKAANPLERESEEMLRSLGYLARQDDRRSAKGIDPKDGLPIYNLLEEARHLAQKSNWPAAEDKLKQILSQVPGHVSARNTLALTLLKQGRRQEAREHYLQSLRDDPAQARVQLMLGNLSLWDGELPRAKAYLQKALELTPGFVEAMSNLGMLSLLEGDEKSAQAWYEKALRQDPEFPSVYRRMADLYFERGNFVEGKRWYLQALRRSARDFRSTIQLGNCCRRLGEFDAAREYFQKASLLYPQSWIPAYNLACLYALSGKKSDALAALKNAVDKGFSDAALARRD
ncbi:MAG TPA: sulfatase-like hydrolase/transferase, partial [Candidatus Binatia bacterium]|nr:sulfatase-like hydrolase/transferase [Candidatus Binatia bacterium]